MLRGLVGAVVTSVVLVLALGWSGALANRGVFAGMEWIALLLVGLLSAVVFWLLTRRSGLGSAKKLATGIAVSIALPLLLIFTPTVFCVLFLPNASCL